MLILLDRVSTTRFVFRDIAFHSDKHNYYRANYYYCANPPLRVIIVCRNDLDLAKCAEQVAYAAIDNDAGWYDFVRPSNEGRRHTKITIYRLARGQQATMSLSQILARAPTDDQGVEQ